MKPKGGGAVYGPRVYKLELDVIRLEAELGKAREESVRLYKLLQDLAQDHLDLMDAVLAAPAVAKSVVRPRRRITRESLAAYAMRSIPTRKRA